MSVEKLYYVFFQVDKGEVCANTRTKEVSPNRKVSRSSFTSDGGMGGEKRGVNKINDFDLVWK
jgi:hypothetical protein